MEAGRKAQQAFVLYQQRLQNLTQIMNQLHEIVKNDEVVENLKDPQMEKYRINRINEIVSDVLNSQKQKMLIRVLQKYEELSKKLGEKTVANDTKQVRQIKETNYYDNLIQLKEKTDKQINKLNQTLQQRNQQILEKEKQIEKLKQSLKVANSKMNYVQKQCSKCDKITKKLRQLQQQKQLADQFIEKLKKDGETAVQMLKQKIKHLSQSNQQLQIQLEKKQTKIRQHKSNSSSMKSQTADKSEKIEVMRKQIAFLQQQLIQVQRCFNIVKDIGLGSTIAEIKKLKNMHKKFKQFYLESLQTIKEQNKSSMKKIMQKLVKNSNSRFQSIKPQKIMSKLNQLDNQLDYFIENQILVE